MGGPDSRWQVGAHPGAQIGGLADVQHLARGVFPEIDPRTTRVSSLRCRPSFISSHSSSQHRRTRSVSTAASGISIREVIAR